MTTVPSVNTNKNLLQKNNMITQRSKRRWMYWHDCEKYFKSSFYLGKGFLRNIYMPWEKVKSYQQEIHQSFSLASRWNFKSGSKVWSVENTEKASRFSLDFHFTKLAINVVKGYKWGLHWSHHSLYFVHIFVERMAQLA